MKQIIFSFEQIIQENNKTQLQIPNLSNCPTNPIWTNKSNGLVKLLDSGFFYKIYEFFESDSKFNLIVWSDDNSIILHSILIIESSKIDENSNVKKITKKYFFCNETSILMSAYDLIYSNNNQIIQYDLVKYSISNGNSNPILTPIPHKYKQYLIMTTNVLVHILFEFNLNFNLNKFTI